MDEHSHLLLDSLAALCGAPVDGAALLSALFVAGLAGGVSHCSSMCGPFVLSQVSTRLSAIDITRFTALTRLRGAALLPYHLGRVTTYTALGATSAWLAGAVVQVDGFRWISSALLLAGAALLLAQLGITLMPRKNNGTGWWARLAVRLSGLASPLFAVPHGWHGYALGIALGFLPCGLIYGAIPVAAAAGNPLIGAAGMAAFGAGTFPALFAVGYGGVIAGRRWRDVLARFARPLLAVNAVLLVAVALRGLL